MHRPGQKPYTQAKLSSSLSFQVMDTITIKDTELHVGIQQIQL